MNTITLGIALAVAVLSFAIADSIRRFAWQLGFVDHPNRRSLHSRTTARGGGAGFAILVPSGVVLHALTSHTHVGSGELALLLSGGLLALVGLADDRWTLPAPAKFASHICAAAALVAAGGVIREIQVPGGRAFDLGVFAAPLTLIWLIFLTNIYNFMDGIDGLAGAQAIVAALTMTAFAVCVGRSDLAGIMIILAAGVVGFMALNWHPARIFMGDVGSTFLGFMFAGWAVLTGGTRQSPLPLVAWVVVLSPFLVDSSVTLISRAWRREPLYVAHRDHIYQRLVRTGWSHASTTILYASLATVAGGLTLAHYCLNILPGPTYLILSACAVSLPLATLRRRCSAA